MICETSSNHILIPSDNKRVESLPTMACLFDSLLRDAEYHPSNAGAQESFESRDFPHYRDSKMPNKELK